MLAALALLTALKGPTTVELTPTDDVWVYPHAADPDKDPYLRVWGAEGKELARDMNELQDFSYSYLKFDVSKVPIGPVLSATLTVTHIAGPGFDAAYARQNPLTARPLPPDFNEKTWDYAKTDQIKPTDGKEAVFGTGAPATLPAEDKEFTIAVDLTKGPNKFQQYLDSARASSTHALALSLSASLDVEERGQKCIYKFYSKDCETASKRPILKITIATP